MKAVNRICQILAVLFSLCALVLFFTKFATITSDAGSEALAGTVLGFGSKIEFAGVEYDLAKSADILFCFLLSAVGFVMSVFSFKSKSLRYTAPVVGLISGIYMLVAAVSDPWKFIDKRPIANVTDIAYESAVLFAAIALLLFAVAAAAYLFIDDYIEVKASKGAKRTIMQRVIGFLRDYKSEAKKIVWPGIKMVLKNTLIVIIMCLLVGALIWLLDFGLAKLLELITG
ncbi:MAG: preprotein translocase subunit SecE [Clostridia bacterium]|nr:preprotein translocase subunit SecE [Clostridia bacterium]MBQ2316237.1 preprotein translocase subunit SecE [Clostridia bacterium]MEE0807855.1 preprotein translocase subunit SecE [Acutalibacteraceae bacterium]